MRYPLAPLAAHLRIELHATGARSHDDRTEAGLALLADRLGIGHRWAKRMLANGLTERQADRAAIRLGLHPCTLWTSWWDDAGDDADWFTDDPRLESLRPRPRLVLTVAPHLRCTMARA